MAAEKTEPKPTAMSEDRSANGVPHLNRDAYDAIAPQWELARVALSDAEARLIEMVLDGVSPGASVLDLGCGTGRPIAEYVVSRGLRVTGVDQSPAMLQLARQRLPDQTWMLARLEAYEPEPGHAAAIAWDSLFHIPRAHHAAILRRVRAALAPGAKLALTVGGSEHAAFTDTMFDRRFFYDSHAPDTMLALLQALSFRILHHAFLDRPTTGRDKGRFAIVASVD